MTLGLFAFLIAFYLVPVGGVPLSEWAWRHAPAHLPALVVVRGSRTVFNGAFYAAALVVWTMCLALGAAVTNGWTRPSLPMRLLTRLVGLCALAVTLACLFLGKPVHGPFSLALAILLTGLLTGLLPAPRRGGGHAGSLSATSSAGSPAPPDGDALAPIFLAPDARPLLPAEPPPLDMEAVVQSARSAHHLTGLPARSEPEAVLEKPPG